MWPIPKTFIKLANSILKALKIRSKRINKIYRSLIKKLYKLIKGWVLPFKSRRILIVKLDSIGDYVLFRNMIACIAQSDHYKGYKISLLGNSTFRDLAERYDSEYIDKFYWIDPEQLYAFSYQLGLMLKIKLRAFDILINPVHSSNEKVEAFFADLGAKYKIASDGDTVNILTPELVQQIKGSYNDLIEIPGIDCFEFIRNREFTGKLIGQPCTTKLQLPVKREKHDGFKITIFPGANQTFRRWSPENFGALINILTRSVAQPLTFEICGSAADGILAAEILNFTDATASVMNQTGQTRLDKLVETIGNSDLLISNETVAVHIGAAADVHVICISNGNHFGRFNPYPADVSDKVVTIYPNEEFYDPAVYQELVQKFRIRSQIDINLIKPEAVAKAAIELIGKR